MPQVRVRAAPSPTGDPHVGFIRTALFDWLYAKHTGGAFVLRIEDTDTLREKAGSTDAIIEGLRWLGLDYDEGPDIGGPHAPYLQSQRKAIYAPLAQQLLDEGKAYRCYCSQERLTALREEQQLNKLSTGYDRRCRNLPSTERAELEQSGAPYTIRLIVPVEGETSFRDRLRGVITFQNSTKVDPVLIKADGMPVYHFASVVDDHLMGITHILRAEEWLSSTPIHVLLYRAFGWEMPELVHLPWVLNSERKKLAKRMGHAGILQLRALGYLPEAVFNFLTLLGWSAGGDREILTRDETIELFDLDGLISHGAIFDLVKLNWMNGEYIRKLSTADLLERCRPYLETAGFLAESSNAEDLSYAEQVIGLAQPRLERLSDVAELTRFFFVEELEIDEKARRKWLEKEGGCILLERYAGAIENGSFDAAALEAAARTLAEELGVGTGQIFHPVRVAVSGRTEGPGLFQIMAVLGRDRTLARLKNAAGTTGA